MGGVGAAWVGDLYKAVWEQQAAFAIWAEDFLDKVRSLPVPDPLIDRESDPKEDIVSQDGDAESDVKDDSFSQAGDAESDAKDDSVSQVRDTESNAEDDS